MNVLHVIPSLARKEGGPSVAVIAMAKAVADDSVVVRIATTAEMRNEECEGRNWEEVKIGRNDRNRMADIGKPNAECGVRNAEFDGIPVELFERNFESYKVSFPLARWLGDNMARFDLVHIHAVFSFSSVMAARVARRVNVPYIVRPLGVLNRWGMQNRRRLLKRISFKLVELPILLNSAAIHYTSAMEREEAGLLDERLAKHSSVVIPLPVVSLQKSEVGNHRSGADDLFAKFPQTKGKRIILFLSRIDPKKGLELLIDAFAAIRKRHQDAALVIAGDGSADYVTKLKKRAGSSMEQGARSVVWTGHLDGELKAAAFAAADVFVLPSASENFGIAAAEAMAVGVPTIVSEEVALSSDIRSYDAGLVVKRDVHELAAAISEMLTNKGRAGVVAANGQRLVREHYSPEAVGRHLVQLYEKVIRSSKDRK